MLRITLRIPRASRSFKTLGALDGHQGQTFTKFITKRTALPSTVLPQRYHSNTLLSNFEHPLYISRRTARRFRLGPGAKFKTTLKTAGSYPNVDSADVIGSHDQSETIRDDMNYANYVNKLNDHWVGTAAEPPGRISGEHVANDLPESSLSIQDQDRSVEFFYKDSVGVEPSKGHNVDNVINVDTSAGERVYSPHEQLLIALKQMEPIQVLETVREKHQDMDKIQLALCMKQLHKYFLRCLDHDEDVCEKFVINLRENPWFKFLVVLVASKGRLYDATITYDVTMFLHDFGYTSEDPELQLFLQLIKHHLHRLYLDQLVALGTRIQDMPGSHLIDTLKTGLRMMVNEKKSQIVSLEPLEKLKLIELWGRDLKKNFAKTKLRNMADSTPPQNLMTSYDQVQSAAALQETNSEDSQIAVLDAGFVTQTVRELWEEYNDFRLDSTLDDLRALLRSLARLAKHHARETNADATEFSEYCCKLTSDLLSDLEQRAGEIKNMDYKEMLADLKTLWHKDMCKLHSGFLLKIADDFLANKQGPFCKNEIAHGVNIAFFLYDNNLFHTDLLRRVVNELADSNTWRRAEDLLHITTIECFLQLLIVLTNAPESFYFSDRNYRFHLHPWKRFEHKLMDVLAAFNDEKTPLYKSGLQEMWHLHEYTKELSGKNTLVKDIMRDQVKHLLHRKRLPRSFSSEDFSFGCDRDTRCHAFHMRDRPHDECRAALQQCMEMVAQSVNARQVIHNISVIYTRPRSRVSGFVFADHYLRVNEEKGVVVFLLEPTDVYTNLNELHDRAFYFLWLMRVQAPQHYYLVVHREKFLAMNETERFDWLKERIENIEHYQHRLYWQPNFTDNVPLSQEVKDEYYDTYFGGTHGPPKVIPDPGYSNAQRNEE